MAVPDVATCLTVFNETCNARYEDRYAQLAERGLMQLSHPGIQRCVAHLQTVTCDEQIRDLDGDCAFMWQGTQPVGSPCGLDVEGFVCGEGTSCVLGLDFCGTCRTEVAVGQPCGDGVVTCGNLASCKDGTCVARRRVGESCAEGDTCVLGAFCAAGTCTAPTITTVGEPCDQATRCPYKSACVGGVCVETALQGGACGMDGVGCASGFCVGGVCEAPRAVGDPCSTSDQCRSYMCVGGRCEALPGRCFDVDGGM
jgi:hypothetical protein